MRKVNSMKDSCFQIKLSSYVWLREGGFISLQSHPEEQPGLWEKSYLVDELLLLSARFCQYLNKIIFGTRLFKHPVDMNVSSNHSLRLMKSGIWSFKIS